LIVTLVFAAALVALHHGCSSPSVPDVDAPDPNFSLDINNPQLKERLGDDDGYSLAVFFGGDIHGSLETCG
jgi:hypothetical protein